MNRHVIADRMLLFVINRFGKPFFSRSVESPPFEAHLAAVEVPRLEIHGTGLVEFTANTLAGKVNQRINVLHYNGNDAPLLVYNMGGGEAPFDHTIRKVYPPDAATELNVVAVEAPWQRTKQQLAAAFAHLNTYLAMIAVAVATTEHVIRAQAFCSARTKLVAGTSLGGFVSNRHHLAFDSADAYLPFVAGTRHGDIFLTTVNASPIARSQPDYLRERLNFDQAWLDKAHPTVFPHLARYDQLNRLEVQSPSYGDMPVDVWEGGHISHISQPDRIRHKIAQVMECVRTA
jgi:hypothetical protein